ncbi:MAG: Phosphoglycolate phosphatase [Promethearchaeota archaeon]|nr:MAG: Phosphoglycolate phosphatase [Candidatus Lokiarchaeota archaeon]
MKNSKIKAIIWDLDGTLIHFKIDFIKARKSALEVLSRYKIPEEKTTIKKSILDNIAIAREYLKSKGAEFEQIEQMIREIDNVVSEIEYEAALKASMINGIDEVLTFAKDMRLKQAIYTFNTTKNAEVSLQQVNLLHFFDVIVGRDKVKNPKPHRDHILHICNHLQLRPSSVLVVGDMYRDIEGAINVGAYSIGLKTRLSRSSDLQKADKIIKEKDLPDKLIKGIQDFL